MKKKERKEKERKENGIQTDKRRGRGVRGTARDVGKRREKRKESRLQVRNERSGVVHRNATVLANPDEIVGNVEKEQREK